MEFGSPQYLNALYAVPLIVLLFMQGSRWRAAALQRFAGGKLGESLSPGASWRRGLLKSTLKVAAVALIILAVARPQFGSQLVKVNREGIDLVIALDVSLSMMAEDMKPNRLERAKQEIIDLIDGLKGDRVGVVAFAGDAFVLCPLTVDYKAALMFTQTADIDIVSSQGTAIDKAIETSLSLFKENAESDQVVILVTDGESHDGDPVGRAREAAERGIRIYTIGIGNPAGELIPLRGTDGGVTGYKKDRSGETVLTRLDEQTLRDVARVSKGKYLPATRDGLELKVLYREMSGLQRSQQEGEFVERKTDRFAWFLAAAFLFLFIETLVTRRASRAAGAARRVLHSGAAGAIVIMLIMLAGVVDAEAKSVDRGRIKSGNHYFDSGEYAKALSLYREALGDTTQYVDMSEGLFYNEGNTLHMMERYEEALGKYNSSLSEDSTQTGQMFYNRGNTLLLMGKFDDAIESYVQSLAYVADDEDARHNLELALKLKQMQEEQQQDQQDQQQQDDQQQGDQDQQQQDQDEQQKTEDQQQGDQDQQQQNQDEQQQQPDSTQTNPASEPDSMRAQQQQSIQLTPEDAMRILRLLEEQEKELQKAKRKAAMQRRTKGKDW